MLTAKAFAMLVMGETTVAVGPERAATMRRDGHSRHDERESLCGWARRRPADLTFHAAYGKITKRNWPARVNRENPDESVPAVGHRGHLLVLAAWRAGARSDQ
jgi:hypothetical protein